MGWLALVGAAIGAYGQYEQGQAAGRSARDAATAREFEALQMDQRANAELAASQRKAGEETRQSKLVQSAVVARAQGGSGDPTVVNILSDLAAEGSYRSAVAIYEGQDRARQARMGAAAARYEAGGYRRSGASAEQAGLINAAGTMIGSYAGGSWGSMFSGSGGGMAGKYGDMPQRQSSYAPYSAGTRLPSASTPGLGEYR